MHYFLQSMQVSINGFRGISDLRELGTEKINKKPMPG